MDIEDNIGFKKEVSLARELGFSGTLIIHPNQIELANIAFSPSKEEVNEAKRIISAIEESKKKGLGVTLLDGKLIGPPMQQRAKALIQKVERINKNKLK